MKVTMLMEEYLTLKEKAENLDRLVATAKTVVKSPNPIFQNDSSNFVNWLSMGEIDNIVYQFGCEEN